MGTNGFHGAASPSSSEVLGAPPRLADLSSSGLHHSEAAPGRGPQWQSAQDTDTGPGACGGLPLPPLSTLVFLCIPGTFTGSTEHGDVEQVAAQRASKVLTTVYSVLCKEVCGWQRSPYGVLLAKKTVVCTAFLIGSDNLSSSWHAAALVPVSTTGTVVAVARLPCAVFRQLLARIVDSFHAQMLL